MAEGTKKAAKKTTSSSTPKKRKMLTASEKVAKLEQQLQDARQKERDKNAKAADKLRDERAKVEEKVNAGRVRMAEIDSELELLGPSGEPATADAAEDEYHGSGEVSDPSDD